MVDTDDPRAAPPRGLLREDAASIGSSKGKNSIAREFSDFVFEFDRCNAETRCVANFLDVR
jgi:hypothetical protein